MITDDTEDFLDTDILDRDIDDEFTSEFALDDEDGDDYPIFDSFDDED